MDGPHLVSHENQEPTEPEDGISVIVNDKDAMLGRHHKSSHS